MFFTYILTEFYLRNFCSWGADNFTFPGRFLARFSSFTLRMRSFSLAVVVRSRRNMFIAVFAAFPLLPVPGVNFTLNLQHNTPSTFATVTNLTFSEAMHTVQSNIVTEQTALLLCYQKIPGSNLSPETGYSS